MKTEGKRIMKTEGKRNLLRQPDEIRLMTGGAQTEQETAPDAAAFRAGDVTVELAEADGSLAVFVQAQNTPVREAGSRKGRYGVLCAGRSRYAGRSI